MSVYFTSDWHLGHKNILTYCPDRPGKTVEEMGEIFIQNTLDTLVERDHLWFLGDVVMGDRAKNLKLLQPLVDAGIRLFLISGNHDYCHPIGHKKYEEWEEKYREVFDAVFTTKRLLMPPHPSYVLCHFPSEADHTETERYNKDDIDRWRVAPNIRIHEVLLHGHLHSDDWFTAQGEIHVGIDADWTEFGVERFHPIPFKVIDRLCHSGSHLTGLTY